MGEIINLEQWKTENPELTRLILEQKQALIRIAWEDRKARKEKEKAKASRKKHNDKVLEAAGLGKNNRRATAFERR